MYISLKSIMSGEIIIKVLEGKEIFKLVNFEANARKTEPEIWMREFNSEEYREKLEDMNIDSLENNKIIVAEEDGEIIGRCDVLIMNSLFDFYNTGYIDWIYVLKDERGRGIGKRLLRGAEKLLKSNDIDSYQLFTANNEQAYEFYHRQKDLNFEMKEVASKEIL